MLRVQQRITITAIEQYKQLPRADRKTLRDLVLKATGWKRQYFYDKLKGNWRLTSDELATLKTHFATFGIII